MTSHKTYRELICVNIHFTPFNGEADLSHMCKNSFITPPKKTHHINYKPSSSDDLQEIRRWDLRSSGILRSVER